MSGSLGEEAPPLPHPANSLRSPTPAKPHLAHETAPGQQVGPKQTGLPTHKAPGSQVSVPQPSGRQGVPLGKGSTPASPAKIAPTQTVIKAETRKQEQGVSKKVTKNEKDTEVKALSKKTMQDGNQKKSNERSKYHDVSDRPRPIIQFARLSH